MRNIFDYLYNKIIYIDNDISYKKSEKFEKKILIEIQNLKSYNTLYIRLARGSRDDLKYIFENILEDVFENNENSNFYFDYRTSKLIDNYYKYMCII